MNIGIFTTSVAPSSAAQAHFQGSLLAGLQKLATKKYRFLVFSPDVTEAVQDTEVVRFVQISRERRSTRAAQFFRVQSARMLLHGCSALGAANGLAAGSFRALAKIEPTYYHQLRRHDVRLLWNMNQHELPVSLPFIRTIWDVNHRIHSMYPEFSYARFGFDGCDHNMANSLARASYVIVGTEEGKRQVVNIFGVHEAKVRVIPFPTPQLPASAGSEAEKSGSGRPYLFYPARLWPHKNHVVILTALKTLREKHGIVLDCIFSGANEGNLEYVLRFADRLGLGGQVEYRGSVSDEHLTGLYKGAFALAYASAVGPDNLPPLEAMALGCPVITADVPGAREQYGDAALYFPATDDLALAERVREIYANPALRTTLIERGLARAARWTTDDYVGAVVQIFDEFAATARAWERCDSAFT